MKTAKYVKAILMAVAILLTLLPTGILAADETSDIPQAYRTIIETYITAINEQWTADQFSEAGLDAGEMANAFAVDSPYYSYYGYDKVGLLDTAGYAVEDVNQDGTPELMITEIVSTEEGAEPFDSTTPVYALYTLSGDQAVLVNYTPLRELYPCGDGTFRYVWGQSTADGVYAMGVYKELKGTALEGIAALGKAPDGTWLSKDSDFNVMDVSGYTPISDAQAQAILTAHPDRNMAFTHFKNYNQPATVPVTGVDLTTDTLTLDAAQATSLQLHAIVLPENATNQNVRWSSSDSTIVTVNDKGVVEAVSAGQATITVTTEDGGFTDTLAVTVIDSSQPETGATVYNQIVEQYIEAIQNNWTADQFTAAGLNDCFAADSPYYTFDGMDRMQTIGFITKDLNNDGIMELLITVQEKSRSASGLLVYDAYTVRDGRAVRVLYSPNTDIYRVYLNPDNTILHQWKMQFNNGEDGILYAYYALTDGDSADYSFKECLAFNLVDGTWYYTDQVDESLNLEDYTPITEAQAQAVLDAHGVYTAADITLLGDYQGEVIPTRPAAPVDPEDPTDPSDPTPDPTTPPANTDNGSGNAGSAGNTANTNTATGIQNENTALSTAAVLAVLALGAAGVVIRRRRSSK